MIDLLIHGGQVVTPQGVGAWDVAIKDGKIVAVSLPNILTDEAARTIDASGKIITPGGIEPHAHLNHYITMHGDANLYSLGPEEDTLGMIFGGVTTMVDFCRVLPGDDLFASLEQRAAQWKQNSFVDYSFHINLGGSLPFEVFEQVPTMIQEGYPSFKVFTCNVLPPANLRSPYKLDFGRIGLLMEKASKHGGILAVHGEDDDILQFNYEQFKHLGIMHGSNMHLVHSKLSEHISFRRTILLAEAKEAAIYFVHISAKEGVEAVAEARSKGLPVYGETLHHYACHHAGEYLEPRGFCYHTYPSLKLPEDQDALWNGLRTGPISTVATDELPTNLEVKLRGETIENITGGNLGAEARMGIMYSEGVVKRGFSLERFVELTSTNAAKILGFYPQKGAIAPGSDADIAIIDPEFHKVLTKEDFHVADYSPWEGWEAHGWPVTTILRGKVMVENRKLVGQLGDGKPVFRKIRPDVLERPGA